MSDRLLRGELDLAIVSPPGPNDHLVFEPLVSEQTFLIGPAGDRLLRRPALTRADLERLPKVILPLTGRRIFPPGIGSALRVESMTPIKQMVADGLGYGALPWSGIHEEVAAGTLAAALLPWIRTDRMLALPKRRPLSRATREAIAALREVCARLIAQGKIRTARPRRPA